MAQQDIINELNYLNETKGLIKQAIINKGQAVPSDTPFRSYVDKIDAIETGIDTSDATATVDDVINPKTFYANGQKLTGTSRITYSPINPQLFNTYISTPGILTKQTYSVTDDGELLLYLTSTNLVIYNLNDSTTISFSLIDYNMSDYSWTTMNTSMTNNNEIYICLGSKEDSRIGACKYNKSTQTLTQFNSISTPFTIKDRYGNCSCEISRLNTIQDKFVIAGGYGDNCNGYVLIYDAINNSFLYSSLEDIWGDSYAIIDPFDRFISKIVFGGGNAGYQRIYWLNNEGNITSYTNLSLPASYIFRYFYQDNYGNTCMYYPEKIKAQKVTVDTINKTITPIEEEYSIDIEGITNANAGSLLIKPNIYSNNDKVIVKDMGTYSNKTSIIAYSKNNLLNDNTKWFWVDVANGKIDILGIDFSAVRYDSVKIKTDLFYNTDDATSSSNDILSGKITYNRNGKTIGTMANNGLINITPSTSQQTIPKGYTSGGTVSAVTSAIDENIQAENIKKDITILGVTGTAIAGDNIIDTEGQDVSVSGTTLVFGNTLPYTELEYIESTGTQYINTDIPITSGYLIKLDMNITSWYRINDGNVCYFAGIYSESANYRDYTVLYQQKPTLGMGSDVPSSISCDLDTWYNLEMSTISGYGYIKLNNQSVLTSSNTVSHTAAYLWLFAVNNNGSKLFQCNAKMKNIKIYDTSNVLIRDYVPAKRKIDNVICLYDKVTNQFFTNQGTGTFTAGPEKGGN